MFHRSTSLNPSQWRGVDVALKELISGGVSTPDSGERDPFDEVSGVIIVILMAQDHWSDCL